MATKLSAYLESDGFVGPIFYQLIFFKKRADPGRNTGHPVPPGQIPASGTTALGSCLG